MNTGQGCRAAHGSVVVRCNGLARTMDTFFTAWCNNLGCTGFGRNDDNGHE